MHLSQRLLLAHSVWNIIPGGTLCRNICSRDKKQKIFSEQTILARYWLIQALYVKFGASNFLNFEYRIQVVQTSIACTNKIVLLAGEGLFVFFSKLLMTIEWISPDHQLEVEIQSKDLRLLNKK